MNSRFSPARSTPLLLAKPNLPQVSVVIALRNAVGTLGATLESVRQQTLQNWEVIVVDDRSTDDSAHLVTAMSDCDNRFRLLRGLGEGMAAARNLGADSAKAKIIAFLDAGDLWDSSKLERHLRLFDRYERLGLTFDRVRMLTPEGRRTWTYSSANVRHLSAAQLLCELPVYSASCLVLRKRVWETLGGFDERLPMTDMQVLTMRVCCQSSWKVEGLARALTLCRTNRNAQANLDAQHRDWLGLMQKMRRYAPDLLKQNFPLAQALHLARLAVQAARAGYPTQGYELFKQAQRSAPEALKPYDAHTLRIRATLAWASFKRFLSAP